METLIKIRNFLSVNSAVILTFLLQYTLKDYLFPVILIRNLLTINFISNILKEKPDITYNNKEREIPKEKYFGEFILGCLCSVIADFITLTLCSKFTNIEENPIDYFCVSGYFHFVAVSLIFEIIFDLFHYTMHRLCHENKFLYLHAHKYHHTYPNPSTVTTYHHTILDLILTNILPIILTTFILSKFINLSPTMLHLINVYKNYVEVSGHSGKSIKGCGFPQCIWIPKFLGIEGYIDNHDIHHQYNNCNFSKRFMLWDKVFGTFRNKIL